MVRGINRRLIKTITCISVFLSLFLAGCGAEETESVVIGDTGISSYFAENDTEKTLVEESTEELEAEEDIVEESVEEAEDEFSEYIQSLKEELDSMRQDVTFEKTHYAADEEKIRTRDLREHERFVDEYSRECIYITCEEGKTLVGYSMPKEFYKGYVSNENDGVMQIDFVDLLDRLELKAEFTQVGNHYEFTITECNDGRFENLPQVLRFYKEDPCVIEEYRIGTIADIDVGSCTFKLYPCGIYESYTYHERYTYLQDRVPEIDYSDMEDDFIQNIKYMWGQIALIQYAEYTDLYGTYLNAVELDREIIEEYHQEEIDRCRTTEMVSDSAKNNTYFFSHSNSAGYDFIKTENGMDSKVFWGYELEKVDYNGTTYRLFYEEEKQEILLGYLIVDIEGKTYYLNDPECDVLSLSYDEILQRSRLVAAEYDVADPNEGQTGLHESITIGEDTCEYQSYDDETGYYLNIVWAEYYGMVRYESGYANGKDQILFEKVMP